MIFGIADYLICLMSFPCHQNYIAGLSHADGMAGGGAPVGDYFGPGSLVGGQPGGHVRQNGQRIFVARIVAGENQ